LIDLTPLERYLFIYLFTNDLSSISGIYKLPMRVIQNETGLDKEFIQEALDKFQAAKKIFYCDGVMWVVNMRKFHANASPRTMAKVNADVCGIPDGKVKTAYLYYEKTGNRFTSESITKFLDYIPKIAKSRRIIAKKPYLADLFRIRGYMKAKGFDVEYNTIDLLEDAYKKGIAIDDLESIVRQSGDWTEWFYKMMDVINDQ